MRNITAKESAFDLRGYDNGKILLINLAKGKVGDMNQVCLGYPCIVIQTAAFSRKRFQEQ